MQTRLLTVLVIQMIVGFRSGKHYYSPELPFKCMSLSLSQACWEPAETFGWEDPIQIRCPSLLHPLALCLAKLLLRTRLFPSGHFTSALRRSKSCRPVPSILLLAALPTSRLPISTLLSNPLAPVVAAAQKNATLFHLLLWISPSPKDRGSTSCFLVEEETDCVLSWILSPASCAVIGLALQLFLLNFLHSPLNYNCQMQKLWEKK